MVLVSPLFLIGLAVGGAVGYVVRWYWWPQSK